MGRSMPIAKFYKWLCQPGGMSAALFCAVLAVSVAMTSPASAQSGQRALPVVSVQCGSDLKLCRALVSVLAEVAPSQIYRINPNPRPPRAFDLKMALNGQGQAQLTWAGGHHGERVARAGMSDMELSRALLNVSPDLMRALRAHQDL